MKIRTYLRLLCLCFIALVGFSYSLDAQMAGRSSKEGAGTGGEHGECIERNENGDWVITLNFLLSNLDFELVPDENGCYSISGLPCDDLMLEVWAEDGIYSFPINSCNLEAYTSSEMPRGFTELYFGTVSWTVDGSVDICNQNGDGGYNFNAFFSCGGTSINMCHENGPYSHMFQTPIEVSGSDCLSQGFFYECCVLESTNMSPSVSNKEERIENLTLKSIELNNQALNIYINNASSSVGIDIKVYNMNGQLVLNKTNVQLNHGQISTNIDRLESGLYTIMIQQGKNILTSKIFNP